ncbi:hypothetical protein C2S52_008380 [Perilla frutescens var. hirtella]|nr:hypothetical protein C2S52_008380 [Perilla frutescens var. hirtella]
MAYRRSIIARTMSFYQQQQRLAPSFSHISTGDREELHTDCISRNSEFRSYIHNPFLMTGNNHSNFQLSRNVFQLRRSEIGVGYGLISHRNLSSASSEVDIAAADSFPPVAALQYLVDYVHCYTGFNWWASIAVTTLLLCVIRIPLLIHRQKLISSKYYKTISSNLCTVGGVFRDFAVFHLDACMVLFSATSEIVTGNIAAWGIVILDITMLSFFFAILNMAEKVPSFITGGTLWFTDLTTPDSMRLPVLLALTLWIRLQVNHLLCFLMCYAY